jgi:3'-5' exoribonuclease
MINIRHYSVEQARNHLIEHSKRIDDIPSRDYCEKSIIKMAFTGSPASTKHHHVYAGGLLVHTAEVVDYCYGLCGQFSVRNAEELLVAAIIHDHMKIKDYEPECDPDGKPFKWMKTWHGEHIYHITEGYTQWRIAMASHPNQDMVERVGHMIVSHHGRPEWGSYIEPKTQAAQILHLADGWSVKYGPGKNAPNN